MRRTNFALRPKASDVRARAPDQPAPIATRKVFNCIVDDTALVAGVKRSTRDGIRKWVSQGAIRLFVPLHTLAQLDRLKKGSDRTSSDARDAILWLDEITSTPVIETSGRVQLEGVEEVYLTWEEVEQFLLPETLLSMEDTDSEEDTEYHEYHEDLEDSFANLDVSDETSLSSSHSLDDPPKTPESTDSAFSASKKMPENLCPGGVKDPSLVIDSPDRTARNSTEIPRADKSSKTAIPLSLRTLFNHILWRINRETNPNAALESFILLTNDPIKQMIAQKFGIRAKRLEQLRDAVAREDREYRNHQIVSKMESEVPKSPPVSERTSAELNATERPKSSHSQDKADSDDEDIVLLKRAPRGPQAQTANGQRVWDPNEFGRPNQSPYQGGRGRGGPFGRGGFGGPRGRGGPPRGRGGFAPRGAYMPPAPPFRTPPPARIDPNAPIDPNSFARPTPRAASMRGTRRKLWEPN